MREITMSIPQFCKLQRGEITLKDIRIENGSETLLDKITSNKQLKKIAVFTLASALYFEKIVHANPNVTPAMAKIDAAGLTILAIVQKIAFWGCIIMAIIDLIKALGSRSTKDIGGIMAKYLMIIAAIYGLPWAFELIRDIFK